jgi:hypothetical protein
MLLNMISFLLKEYFFKDIIDQLLRGLTAEEAMKQRLYLMKLYSENFTL